MAGGYQAEKDGMASFSKDLLQMAGKMSEAIHQTSLKGNGRFIAVSKEIDRCKNHNLSMTDSWVFDLPSDAIAPTPLESYLSMILWRDNDGAKQN